MRFVIESHEPLTQNVYHMRLSGDTRAFVSAVSDLFNLRAVETSDGYRLEPRG